MKALHAAAAVAASASTAFGQQALATFVFDQTPDALYRLVDLNGDGDANDAGEVTLFYDDSPAPALGLDNAAGLVALSDRAVLATDNFDPDNILRLEDLNGDGDAFDAGEAAIWFDGILPSGLRMTLPFDLRPRRGGGYLLLDSNVLDVSRPEAVYALEDLNGDGDVNDGQEVTLLFELSPVGVSTTSTFDVVEGVDGLLYTLDIDDDNDIESIDVLDPDAGTRSTWFDSVDLLGLAGFVLLGTAAELEYIPDRGEVVFVASALGGAHGILGARDADGNGVVDQASEVRVLWSESGNADGVSGGTPRDLFLAPDGSMLFVDALADRVVRLVDANGDGDYQDAGETRIVYDDDDAEPGLPDLELPLTVSAALVCRVDFNGDGLLDFFDISAFLAAFNASDLGVDLNGDGLLDFFDVSTFLAEFAAGCA